MINYQEGLFSFIEESLLGVSIELTMLLYGYFKIQNNLMNVLKDSNNLSGQSIADICIEADLESKYLLFLKDNPYNLKLELINSIKKKYTYLELKVYLKDQFFSNIVPALFKSRDMIGLQNYLILFYSNLLIDLRENIEYISELGIGDKKYVLIVGCIEVFLDNIINLSEDILKSRKKMIDIILGEIMHFFCSFLC